MKGLIVVGAALLLQACGTTESAPLQWRALKDGSRVASQNVGNDEQQGVARCWKEGQQWDCLTVTGDNVRQVRRTISDNLPTMLDGMYETPGYNCVVLDNPRGYQEEILGGQGVLTRKVSTDTMGTLEEGWPTHYADKYIADNGVKATTRYLACREVAMLIHQGSNATIGTLDVSRALLDGKVRVPDE